MHILVTSEPQLIKQNIFTIEMLKRLILFVCRTGIIRTLKQVRSRGSRTKREEGRDSRRRRFQGTARTGTSPASCRRYTRVETKTSRRLKYIGWLTVANEVDSLDLNSKYNHVHVHLHVCTCTYKNILNLHWEVGRSWLARSWRSRRAQHRQRTTHSNQCRLQRVM